MYKILGLILLISPLVFSACNNEAEESNSENISVQDEKGNMIKKSDEEWKKVLTKEEYFILREKGTERAFSGEYVDHKENGTYTCAACGNEIFSSSTKFKSGTGWPSYWAPINEQNIILKNDPSLGMSRDEILCAQCGGHLGHVFDDGPEPTGLRYCVNSAALDFKKKEK